MTRIRVLAFLVVPTSLVSIPARAQECHRGAYSTICAPTQRAAPRLSPPAPDPRLYWIGVTVAAQGDVTFIYPNGQRVAGDAAASTPVPFGARVTTGPTGRLQVTLRDGTQFSMGSNSEMVMDRFVYDPGPRSWSELSLRFATGVFRYITGHIARRDARSINIGTPVATIGGIRGTEIEVNADPGGSGYIANIEGEFDVTEYDTGRVFTLRRGQRLVYENFAIVGMQ